MNQYNYSDEDRKKVIEQSKEFKNHMQGVSQAFAYNMYDVMRLQLEELHRIGDTMESMLNVIQNEGQQNR